MKYTGNVHQIEYTLTYRKGARRIVLRYDVHGKLHASAPYFTPKREVERFILDSLVQLEAMKKPEPSWQEGMELYLEGRPVRLVFDPLAHTPFLLLDELHVRGGDRDEVVSRVRRFYRDEARRRIVPLVDAWKKQLGLTVGKISFRDSHRVWASCSRKGSLSFSIRCAGLDGGDLSYLVLHELAHRVHFNHGPLFHAYLSLHMPSWKERERHLALMQKKCDVFSGR